MLQSMGSHDLVTEQQQMKQNQIDYYALPMVHVCMHVHTHTHTHAVILKEQANKLIITVTT